MIAFLHSNSEFICQCETYFYFKCILKCLFVCKMSMVVSTIMLTVWHSAVNSCKGIIRSNDRGWNRVFLIQPFYAINVDLKVPSTWLLYIMSFMILTTIDRPTIECCPNNFTPCIVFKPLTLPALSQWIFPQSPTCLFHIKKKTCS